LELRVVATAGHVDHGKSSLIQRLTGMDPDRWEEEKRRGLTIDLGYAWCRLPSGREIGFVDVPGHERFIANMLAGVGPVRLVLFVVAADEGWKPQSEEHLQILDLLGVDGGVIALTKSDLVDADARGAVEELVRAMVEGTTLAPAPVIPVSSVTGEGLDEIAAALDSMIDGAAVPASTRARLFVDRVFTIKGAGTVATGTLGGDCIAVGDEVKILPEGLSARVRALQTHRASEDRACPVARVAANLAGTDKHQLARGDVIARPDVWRATSEFDAVLRPVRGADSAVTMRGAFKLYAGASEVEAKLRFLDPSRLDPGGEAFVRVRTSRPVVLDVFDRFVIRDDGRRETVAGGEVLDPFPPARAGADARERLMARAGSSRDDLPGLLTAERGWVRASEALVLTGSSAGAGVRIGEWFVSEDVLGTVERDAVALVETHHREHPLDEGAPVSEVRGAIRSSLRRTATADAALVDALLDDLVSRGVFAETDRTVRLPSHTPADDGASAQMGALLEAVGGDSASTPPTIEQLIAAGFGRDLIEAAARSGAVVKVGPDLLFTSGFISKAEGTIRDAGAAGITVSAFRERLGTTRKYAVPLMEWFDQKGVTRREGDLRFARGT
jgi:selenocysteine-specific elongation factor